MIAIHEVRDGKIARAWFRMGQPRLYQEAQLRRAVLSDAASIRELTRAAYARWAAAIGREPTPMTVDYGEQVQEHHIDLLHVGNQLAAIIEMVAEADHLLIENIAVLPVFQAARIWTPPYGPCRDGCDVSRSP